MKKYSIYLRIEEWGDADLIEKQFKKAKKIFIKAIKTAVEEKKIIIAKEQATLNAVDLSVNEEYLEEILELFRSIEVTDQIDAEYTGPKEL